jgi:hypothetical protein
MICLSMEERGTLDVEYRVLSFTPANIDFLQCHKPNMAHKADDLDLPIRLISVRYVHLSLRFQNMHLPAYHPPILRDSRLELRDFPHNAQKPNICGTAQNNGLNFVQVTKSEVRLRICAYCICTCKSALHRILPHFQSPSKYPASGFEDRLSGSFSSLHCMFLRDTLLQSAKLTAKDARATGLEISKFLLAHDATSFLGEYLLFHSVT